MTTVPNPPSSTAERVGGEDACNSGIELWICIIPTACLEVSIFCFIEVLREWEDQTTSRRQRGCPPSNSPTVLEWEDKDGPVRPGFFSVKALLLPLWKFLD